MFCCTERSQSPDNPFELPLRSMRNVTWHEQSSCYKSMNEQQFLKILVSYGAMVLFFIAVWLGHWGKFYPWRLITSNMGEGHLMAYL